MSWEHRAWLRSKKLRRSVKGDKLESLLCMRRLLKQRLWGIREIEYSGPLVSFTWLSSNNQKVYLHCFKDNSVKICMILASVHLQKFFGVCFTIFLILCAFLELSGLRDFFPFWYKSIAKEKRAQCLKVWHLLRERV